MEKIIDSLNELDIDWVKLKKWYVRQAKIQARKQRLNLPIAILFFIVLNTANILFLLSYLEEKKEQLNRMVRYDNSIIIDDIGGLRSDHTEERKKIDDTLIGLITFAFFFTITFIQIYPFIFFRLNHYLKEVNYKRLDRNSFQSLWSLIDDLSQSMSLNMNVQLFYLQENNFEAHILKEKDNINLFLSRKMISFYSQDLQKFKVILAHEFGHVIQGDTKFLLSGVQSLRKSFIISYIGFIIAYIIGLEYGASAVLAITSFIYYSIFRKRRHEAEYLADIASVCYLQNKTIAEVLELSIIKDTPFYPTKMKRLSNLYNTLHRFQTNHIG
ncbi:M48 family metalloprotease [Emticicia sp. BO119]|uniref:M48 family metalloprotease n=1 Tax=Emticicia sp. BO119 TaxID=2757768 RepID=UPI0015F02008|nr:M48 family metalloprotease [Emticicia sp. BO119]MBA4850932.1 M48 family metalloprotease [Emticicia sp. BO119]